MKTPLLSLALSAALLGTACTLCTALDTYAAGPAAPKPAASPSSTPPASYLPKTKSSFTVAQNGHNPFWPIGFFPTPKSNRPVEDQLLRIPVEQFRISSIFAGDDGIAVINGKDYTRGQFLSVPTGTGVAKILITKIEDGYIVVQYKTLVARIEITRK